MSEFSFPFTGGGGGDDGPYSAEFFAGILEGLFRQDEISRANAGVLSGSGNGSDPALQVTETSPASNSVEVKAGKALVQGYYYLNDSDISITVPANNDGSGFDRIDTIVLEIDFVANTVRANIVTGTPAAVPVAPTLTKTSSLYQIPLANIEVVNLFTTILNADIDNSVKEQGVLWNTVRGGTGIQGGFVTGDMIGADSAENLVRISLDDFHTPMRDDSQANGFGQAVIPAVLLTYELAHATNGATGTINVWNTLPFNNVDDQAGLLTSLSGGTMTLEYDGEYIIENVWASWDNTTGGVQQMQFRIFNVTTATEIDRGVARDVGTAAQYAGDVGILQPIRFTASAGDQIEVQMFMEDNGVNNFIWGLNRNVAINGVDQPELYAWGTLRKVG